MSFAVTVSGTESGWSVKAFKDDFTNAQTAIQAVWNLRSEHAAFALLCVEDEYLVIVRPAPNKTRVLISDITMAVDDPFAEQLANEANLDIPDIDPDELDDIDGWPDGDFDILADLGLSEELMSVYVDDQDPYPHEVLLNIASELGFDNELMDAADY